jgi:hypothetical protein
MVSYLSIKGSGAWPTQGRNPATFPRCHGGRGTGHLKDVAPSLTQFRSAMVAIPKNFHQLSLELTSRTRSTMSAKTVLPASEAIGRAVRDNRSLPSLAAGMAGAANTACRYSVSPRHRAGRVGNRKPEDRGDNSQWKRQDGHSLHRDLKRPIS